VNISENSDKYRSTVTKNSGLRLMILNAWRASLPARIITQVGVYTFHLIYTNLKFS